MFIYQLRLALISLRRNPFLSILIVLGIALGIAVSTTFITAHYLMSGNPIPHKSEKLFYVQIDNWDPNRPWNPDRPEELPDQLTYRDMVELMKSDIPTYQSGMYRASVYLYPDPRLGRPFKAATRMCFADFFELFEVPFAYGSGWDTSADNIPEPVVVLSHDTNQRLFGGEDSTGKMLRIEDREFRVVGVLKPWQPRPKFYDPHNGAFEEPEEIFIPFNFVHPWQLRTAGNTNSWKSTGDTFSEFLQSEATWIQMWVQLDSSRQQESYQDYMNAYYRSQQALGRMERPVNTRIVAVMQWLEEQRVVPDTAKTLVVISLLFLLVCALNLIGILLGKFLARAPEVGVRRALGASRRSIFLQHMVECKLIGLVGGVAGILLSLVALRAINTLFRADYQFELDGLMTVSAVGLSLVAGLIAGIYPSWKICSIPPAVYLKEQ